MEETRPNPDELLAALEREQAARARAKLKIFFGFAPGVGKTYAMLEAARRAAQNGADVLVGLVETHGRVETQRLLDGLAVLPRAKIDYRGHTLDEFDIDAALQRKPALILVDELAHTNAPGSRHKKRWQDVLDLLDAGIDVYTTMNVQHVESLNDVVAQITHVQVRETVPDHLLDRADQIELVDISPEELLERLQSGKVYLQEQAARAADSFFKRGNLLALRELALRRAAERVESDVRAYREQNRVAPAWAIGERIIVCVGPAPASERVIRGARRIAAGLRAPWTAIWVEDVTAPPLSSHDQSRLEMHLRLAESLGAQVITMSGSNPAAAVLDYARQVNASRIVIGKPTHARWRDRLRRAFVDEVIRGSGNIDVNVISGDESQSTDTPRPDVRPKSTPSDYGWAFVAVAMATAVGYVLDRFLALPDIVMLYLLGIIVVGVTCERGAALVAAALSVGSYDFFFVPPRYTFDVADARHSLTFVMMFAVGMAMSTLALRLRRQERAARQRELRTTMLYDFTRALSSAHHARDVVSRAVDAMSATFATSIALLLPRTDGTLAFAAQSGALWLDAQALGVAKWSFEHGRAAGVGTDSLPGAPFWCVPLTSGAETVGVLAIAPREDGSMLDVDQRTLLEAFVRQLALVIERTTFAEAAKRASVRAKEEELRSTLLSAVSHDLRTPLASIKGSATALEQHVRDLPPEQRELVSTIAEESERLERLVTNILEMVKIESGVALKREWVPIEELTGPACVRLERLLAGHRLRFDMPDDPLLLHVDAILFEQVVVNLLENAAKHTPVGTEIVVRATREGERVTLSVADHGAGLAQGDEARVFDKFYRGAAANHSGAGLGLAICQAIVQAHGGTLTAKNQSDGGAVFEVSFSQPSQPVVETT